MSILLILSFVFSRPKIRIHGLPQGMNPINPRVCPHLFGLKDLLTLGLQALAISYPGVGGCALGF